MTLALVEVERSIKMSPVSKTDPFLQRMFQKESFEENGLLVGRPTISTEFKGHRVVAVGSRLYHSLPINITFHEFLITFLKDTVGPSWGLAESENQLKTST